MRYRLLTTIVIVWASIAVLHAATFLSDTFTDTSGVDLDFHTPDSGGTWTVHPNNGGGGVQMTDHNDLQQYVAFNSWMLYNTQNPNSAEYNVEADFIFHSGSIADNTMQVLGRMASGAETFYACGWDGFFGGWTLHRAVAGSYTSMDTDATSLSTGTYNIRLEITDATKKCFINDVETLTSADNTITATGFVGVTGYHETNPGGFHMDNLLAYDIEGGGGGESTAIGRLLLLGVGGQR